MKATRPSLAVGRPERSRTSKLWAVTSYFNPVGYRRRRLNYQTFREQLAAPLVTVELSFNGTFELAPQDADILIQIHGRDVMWQKERLLNLAVQALPECCTQVAILDCDVLFLRPDWMEALSRRLEDVPLAQPFSNIHYAPAEGPLDSPAILVNGSARPSLAYLMEQGRCGRECLLNFTSRGPGTRCSGHAIAARRELLAAHGLYDVNIIGGGDNALVSAAVGAFEAGLAHQHLNRRQLAYYSDWAKPFWRDVAGELACVHGDLIHLWHGEIGDRRTLERHREFAAFGFDPAEDIALAPGRSWRWNSDKEAMHNYVRNYFANRWEDGRPEPAQVAPAVAAGPATECGVAQTPAPRTRAKRPAPQAGPLWALTSYFNPAGYRRRRENYRVFRDQLKLPLATIELSFDGRFQLGPQDAELLIQVRGRDVMWQKERLLNLAIGQLPVDCTQVALLDCDIVFKRADWAECVSRRLDEVPLLQPFATVHYPGPDVPWNSSGAVAGGYTRPSVGSLVEQGAPMGQLLGHFPGRLPGIRSPGHALAVRRDLIQEHGLFDAAIVGGGDTLLLAAALGHPHVLTRIHAMNEAYAAYYLAWARRFERDVRGRLGSVPGDLIHLWHGSMEDRRSPERYHALAAFDYSPAEDIAVDPSGAWRWNSDKPDMHAYLRDYFAIRNEDGIDHGQFRQPIVLQAAA